MGLFRTIMFAITSVLYNLIPGLYKIFYTLGTNEFFKSEDIKAFSNNIYIVISTVMLFALGIRLLTAIVNPDSFNDKKKGVRQTFINCVIAVILIGVIPLAFDEAYKFQNEDTINLVPKLILGRENNDDSLGQTIAKESFQLFCHPAELFDDGNGNYSGEEDVVTAYNSMINGDIDDIGNLGEYVNDKTTDGKNTLEFHPILSPAFGAFMVYQMILLCLDIALRTIKLAVLQIISPIVICGFIVSGTEILQRWFKEVASTYILLFVKVAAVVFMIVGLEQLTNSSDGFISNIRDSLGNKFFAVGFAEAAIIIALLTIVKNLPDIINGIFGTKLKNQGGIAGRLKNMAAVGDIASNAWGKVTKAAGNIGLKAAGAGALLASGPIGWGAAAGALGVHRGWNRGIFGTGPWKDMRGGRALRTIGAGAKGVGVGLTAKGGIFAGISAGRKSYADSGIGAINAKARRINDFEYAENNSNIRNGILTTTADPRMKSDARTIAARTAAATTPSIISNNMGRVHANSFEQDLNKYSSSSFANNTAINAKKSYDDIKNKLDAAIANVTNDKDRETLQSIKGNVLGGKQSIATLSNVLKRNGFNELATDISFDADKYVNTLNSDIVVDGKNYKMYEVLGMNDAYSGTGIGNFSAGLYTSIGNEYNTTKEVITKRMEIEKVNERQKAMIEKTMSDIDTIQSTLAASQAKWNK